MKKNYIKLLAKKKKIINFTTEEGKIKPVTLINILPHYLSNIYKNFNINQVEFNLSSNFEMQNKLKIIKSKFGYFNKINLYPLINTLKSKLSIDNFNNLLTNNIINNKYKLNRFFNINNLKIKNLNITSKNKGLGFTGTIKRYNFKQGPKTHGSKSYKRPGSIGAGTTPGRVFKRKKMPGQSGNKNITIKNINILKIKGNNYFLDSIIPGKKNATIILTCNL